MIKKKTGFETGSTFFVHNNNKNLELVLCFLAPKLRKITKKYGTPKLFLGLLKCDGAPKLTGDSEIEP